MCKDQLKSDQPTHPEKRKSQRKEGAVTRICSSLWHARKSCDEVEKNHPLRVGKHVVLELKSVVKVTATALLRGVLVLVLQDASVSRLAGGLIAIASVGNGRRPHPCFCRRRLRFWPEAITKAKPLTRQSRRKRKRRIPCHCLPSPNSGSIHTFRLLSALW